MDIKLDQLILVELEKMLGYENTLDIPQMFVEAIRNDVECTSNYPNYNSSDITIAVRRNVLNAITYWAN